MEEVGLSFFLVLPLLNSWITFQPYTTCDPGEQCLPHNRGQSGSTYVTWVLRILKRTNAQYSSQILRRYRLQVNLRREEDEAR